MSFLPDGYQAPANKSNYLKLEEGANKFRILSKSIVGWLDWEDKKPKRTREYPETLVNPEKPAKHFWAFVVWDYKTSSIKILELTQRTVQNAIIELYKNEDWGDPTRYDLTIQKTGKTKDDTKYTVIPTPPKPMTSDVLSLYESLNINLEALYTNGDPFANAPDPNYDVSGEAVPGIPGDNTQDIVVPF